MKPQRPSCKPNATRIARIGPERRRRCTPESGRSVVDAAHPLEDGGTASKQPIGKAGVGTCRRPDLGRSVVDADRAAELPTNNVGCQLERASCSNARLWLQTPDGAVSLRCQAAREPCGWLRARPLQVAAPTHATAKLWQFTRLRRPNRANQCWQCNRARGLSDSHTWA